MERRPAIGAVVQAWREALGLTLTQLAERAGRPITKGYLSQVERGKIQRPGEGHMQKLAAALGLSVSDLETRRMPNSPLTATPLPVSGRPLSVAAASLSLDNESVGEQIDRELLAAELTPAEEALVRDHLLKTAREMIALVRAAQQLVKDRNRHA